jgi:hypothetical protein
MILHLKINGVIEWTYSILENDKEPNDFWDLLSEKLSKKYKLNAEEYSIIKRDKDVILL